MTPRPIPTSTPFRLSMLIYDTRFRSYTIQFFAFLGFIALVFWLANNTTNNLENLGKPLSFTFLGEPSGYDINQHLIEYSSQDSHFKAAAVGLLNTLLVAFLGCIAATIIGVFVGVLRLSNNWIVEKVMTVYVEIFRNVPLLLWLVFIMAIMIESLPSPSAFRGDNATASMILNDSVAITNRGIYLPVVQFSHSIGDFLNMNANILAIIAIFATSVGVAYWLKRRVDKRQRLMGERSTTWHIRVVIIFIPTLLVLYILGAHFVYPELQGFNFKNGLQIRNSLLALWVALSLYTAAFIAEIVRAGILSVSTGQSEAANALGISAATTMRLVVLPQALRVIIPPMISNFLNLTKNSSLAIAVGYMDLTGTLGGISMNQTGRELESVMLLMLCYLAISISISSVMNWYNNSMKLVEQ